ncbi:MAG: putative metallopeptidase domain protein [Podoviridae sp. ctda_1]|nr:MAG: putative metallopeptidase domain protein [Podoviridae sp. ctda_1]
MDEQALTRELDKVKADIFTGRYSAFLGSVMTSMEFIWDDTIDTAATNGEKIWWNPTWFMTLPFATRCFVMRHELAHVYRLHGLRLGSRDHELWNIACDYRINNDDVAEGGTYHGTNPMVDPNYDINGIMAEEDIYDQLKQKQQQQQPMPMGGSFGAGDLDLREFSGDPMTVVGNVIRAVQLAKLSGQPGNLPGEIEELVTEFLKPIVPWEKLLMEFFTDALNEDWTWARPNRRYSDIYLPSRYLDDGRLRHVMFVEDVSGSITNDDLKRFNSEVKYIWDVLQPEKLTLVQFDEIIQSYEVLTEGDTLDKVKIIGRGGTNLAPVKELIDKEQPSAVVIFSDLECRPMEKPKHNTPVVWVVIRNKDRRPSFGKFIHIN